MNSHLNDMQLFALLDAPDTAASDPHLAMCATCRAEFEQLHGSLGNFRATATNFADAHLPAHLPNLLLHTERQPRPRLFTLPRAAWTTGLVAAMALGTASLSMLHKAPTPAVNTASATPTTPSQTVSTATTDDALLEDIDNDLSTSVPPSLAPLETTSTTSGEKTTTSN